MIVTAVIAAAGSGSRMGNGVKKQYIELAGKPVLSYSLEVFLKMDEIDSVVLVIPEGDRVTVDNYVLKDLDIKGKIILVNGGSSRQESVEKGIIAAPEDTEILVVHDGARPFVTEEIIAECIHKAKLYGACVAAVPIKDTVKQSLDGQFVDSTPRRDSLFSVQTPQAFNYELIRMAHEKAHAEGFEGTDDAMLVEACGGKVAISAGAYGNIKLTSPEDVALGEILVKNKREMES
ncbi:MAG: 2-C-methyl-D-erythritol 4-phosphate cytidylyltransferase [Peptostreptococcaceae bacterium]|nr:2-C-methyl-D-erythritol 4-phosphate cytidylyltransferase [Peptostreptococcaceae bacterium]